ncbi:MAG: glycosyltransferase [Lachnospiraceae bacterium]|nr:glycosyltransferase [Lachnospiraceae bacterium]
MSRVDVIIPVYKPTRKLFTLLDRLEEQTVEINRIILINTEQKYFDALTAGSDFWDRYKNVTVKHITKGEFDHGNTRRQAVKDSKVPYFVMMTDDAVPADRYLLERLLEPVEKGKAAMSYARQLTDESSSAIEKFTREFNYPGQSMLKSKEDLEEKGIKTFFASNVCAAYNREIYDSLGGFVKHTIFNEDMIYARGLIDKGYCIAYAAEAKVYHAHNYSSFQQFQRNFDLGVSHAQYPAVFEKIATTGEGMRLVMTTAGNLLKQGKPFLIIKLFWQSGWKYLGFFLGKRYKRLPSKIVKICSMNKDYWK